MQLGVDPGTLLFARPELHKEQRYNGQRGDQRGGQRIDDREANLFKKLSGHPIHQRDRQEDDHGGQGGGDDRAVDQVRTLDGCISKAAQLVLGAEAAVEHNNRVVDHHADTDDQSTQRHDVHGHTGG